MNRMSSWRQFLPQVSFVLAFGLISTSPVAAQEESTAKPVEQLMAWLSQPAATREQLGEQSFATEPLSATESVAAKKLLWQDRMQQLRLERQAEMEAGVLKEGDLQMPFFVRKFGMMPEDGWSVFLSMHGGGGAPTRVNDQQWENQKRLYELNEGIYVAPRAPTDSWNLWHQPHIDVLFQRLIENLVALEGANPNRVYVMGYSAGGDGVYQLAPRLCDRWAAAAMMAGHPNDASPLGLRNVPFALQVGGRDAAYRRNEVAQQWSEKLKSLQLQDPSGYMHFAKIYSGKGHWMDREDAVAIPWMAKFTRNPTPDQIVWQQDDVTVSHCYWLSVDPANQRPRSQITAALENQQIRLSSQGVERVTVHLDDRFIDLNQPVSITSGDNTLFTGTVKRTIAHIADSLGQTGDVELSFPASVSVELPVSTP